MEEKEKGIKLVPLKTVKITGPLVNPNRLMIRQLCKEHRVTRKQLRKMMKKIKREGKIDEQLGVTFGHLNKDK